MIRKLLLLAGLLPLFARAQDFTLKGRIGHFNAPAKIYFDHMEGETSHSDSAVLVDGQFSFAGKVNGPGAVRMALAPKGEGKEKAIYGGGEAIYFFIGPEHINLRSKDSLSNAVITGSPVNDAYNAYNVFIGGSIMDLNKAANADFNKGTEEQKKDTAYFHAVDRRFRQRVAERAGRELEFAKTHPHDFFSVVALTEQTQDAAGALRSRTIFATLDESLRLSFAGKKLDEKMAALTAVVAGSMAPDFTQPDTAGQSLTLSRLRGKYVLVDFWASWCSPCRAENPNLKKQYQLYKGKGFEVISVSLDDNKKKWVDAIAKDGLPWLQVSDLKGWSNEAGKLYGISAVPSSFLVDPQGKIVATGLVGETLNKKRAEIFGPVAGTSGQIPLKILYVGYSPDRPLPEKQVYMTKSDSVLRLVHQNRMNDWRKFLEKNFMMVRTVDVRDYSAKLSDSADVTIMDAGPVSLPAGFDRPMILMHAMAPLVGMPIGLKFDWYCQCLDADALNIRTGHAIFHIPNEVHLTLVQKTTPPSFYNGFQGATTPPVMPMWQVNTQGYVGDPYLIGMVAHGEGFDDSPDAESISGGVCMKNAEAVALGRQGNYFMWGFSGSPEYMTEEANQVFVNTICYIKKFDHQTALVKKVQVETRELLDELIYRIDRSVYDKAITSRREGNLRLKRMQDSLRAEKTAGKDIGHGNEMFLKMPMTDAVESFEDYIKGFAGDELFAKFGTHTDLYRKYYRDNYEYYYPRDGYSLQLDADAQHLGLSNRKVAILEKCIGLLESGKDTARAMRVLRRYTMESFATAALWRRWLTENKSRLFYTESGGFKFVVNTYAAAAPVAPPVQPAPAKALGTVPTSADPVAIEGRLEKGRLVIDADILKGWHIYAYVGKDAPFVQTEMLLDLPEGAVSDKEWQSSAGLPFPGNDGIFVYEGKVRFSLAVDCSRVKPGSTIRCGLYYQVCDNTKCFPPRRKTVDIKI
ncbi:MAG TPA: redoxin domain-containing protein [Puia sp.]|nr:redoxin domain-containing protein [Puia sp.]